MQGVIKAVGSGNRDETGKLVPLDVKAGDSRSVRQNIPAPKLRSMVPNI